MSRDMSLGVTNDKKSKNVTGSKIDPDLEHCVRPSFRYRLLQDIFQLLEMVLHRF